MHPFISDPKQQITLKIAPSEDLVVLQKSLVLLI